MIGKLIINNKTVILSFGVTIIFSISKRLETIKYRIFKQILEGISLK